MLDLFVMDAVSSTKIPVMIATATRQDLLTTQDWQTNWTTSFAEQFPNKVALYRVDDKELLGLMSYELGKEGSAVEIIYVESAHHSNANLLAVEGRQKNTLALRKHCLPTQYRYPRTPVLAAYWFLKLRPVNCWTIIDENLVQGKSALMILFEW